MMVRMMCNLGGDVHNVGDDAYDGDNVGDDVGDADVILEKN